MERTEELLLNHTLNWCSGYFREKNKKPQPYLTTFRANGPPSVAKIHTSMFITDEYCKFIQWLKDARVLVLLPQLPDDLALLQHRLERRDVKVESSRSFPIDTPMNLMGIVSNPDIVRAIPNRRTVAALIPASFLPQLSGWRCRVKERLDLFYMQNGAYREFLKRQLARTGMTTPLTPQDFRFLSGWLLVLVHTNEQSAHWHLDDLPPLPQPVWETREPEIPWVMPGAAEGRQEMPGAAGAPLYHPVSPSYCPTSPCAADDPPYTPAEMPTPSPAADWPASTAPTTGPPPPMSASQPWAFSE